MVKADQNDPLQDFLELIGDGFELEMRRTLEVTTLIGRLVARVTAETSVATSSGEVSASEMDVLAFLAGRGEPFRAKPSELAQWANVTGAAITGRVDQLERHGLVSRALDEVDRRVRWIILRPSGLELLRDQARGIVDRPLFAEIQKLTQRDRASLVRVLRKLARAS